MAGRALNRDEWTTILDYYYRMPEAYHTDSHRECIAFAATIGRPPGTVDSSLRNIKSVDKGRGRPNIASAGIEVYKYYAERPREELVAAAGRAMKRMNASAQ